MHPVPIPTLALPLKGREQTAASPGPTGKSEGPTEEVVLVANRIGTDASGETLAHAFPLVEPQLRKAIEQ